MFLKEECVYGALLYPFGVPLITFEPCDRY